MSEEVIKYLGSAEAARLVGAIQEEEDIEVLAQVPAALAQEVVNKAKGVLGGAA